MNKCFACGRGYGRYKSVGLGKRKMIVRFLAMLQAGQKLNRTSQDNWNLQMLIEDLTATRKGERNYNEEQWEKVYEICVSDMRKVEKKLEKV